MKRYSQYELNQKLPILNFKVSKLLLKQASTFEQDTTSLNNISMVLKTKNKHVKIQFHYITMANNILVRTPSSEIGSYVTTMEREKSRKKRCSLS